MRSPGCVLLRFLSVPGLVFLAGCPQPPGPGCTSDLDCLAGQVCEGGECVADGPPGHCAPELCDDNDPCTTEQCVDTDGDGSDECVNTPVECPEGMLCDPDTGECVVDFGPECTLDSDCAAGEVCINGECEGNDDCGYGEDEDSDLGDLPPADPDPCAEIDPPCESVSLGPYIVFSTMEECVVSTTATAADGSGDVMYFDWVPVGDAVELIAMVPGDPPLAPWEIDAPPPSLQRANVLAGVILGLGASSAQGPGLVHTRSDQSGNHAGCDPPWLQWASCRDHGSCCDDHDTCIHHNCTGSNGDVRICLVNPFCSLQCRLCHAIVIACFLNRSIFPGPSECCSRKNYLTGERGDCGLKQQCIGEDYLTGEQWVETDPCKCDEPVDPCCGDGECESGETSSNCPEDCDDCDDGDCWGDPHLVTFDGLAYDFQAVGEFIMVRSLSDSLEVQARMKPWRGSRVVSVQNAVAMNVAGDQVEVYVGRTPALYVNGLPTELDAEGMSLPSGGNVVADAGFFYVSWPDGSRVRIHVLGSYLNLKICLRQSREGSVQGLLGDFDGSREGELVIRDGAPISTNPSLQELYLEYGESWRVSQEESLFDYLDGNTTETHADRTFPDGIATLDGLSQDEREWAEQICRDAGVTNPIVFDACVLDVALTGDPSFAENSPEIPILDQSHGLYTGTIDPADDEDIYTFTGNAGDVVFIQVNRTSGGLNPQIQLYPPGGLQREALAGTSTFDDHSVAALFEHPLAESGEYTILVLDHGLNDTGDYVLSLLNLSGALTSPQDPDGGPIASEETRTGAIGPLADQDAYTFTGNAGDLVFIQVNRTSGGLNPQIRLYPPSGLPREALAGTSTFDDHSVAALFEHPLAEPGEYTILVLDHGLNDTGDYVLSLTVLP